MGFILEFGVCSISPEPWGQFSMKLHLNVPLSETMCGIFELATKTQGQSHTSRLCALPFNLCPLHISWPHGVILIRLLPKCSSQLANVKNLWPGCANLMSRSHFKVMEFNLHFVSTPYLINPSNNFHINFTQIFLSVMQCAGPMTQLCRLKVKVTLQCHGIYPWISCPFQSPKPFARFSFNITQMFLSVSWLQNPWLMQLCKPKVKVTL